MNQASGTENPLVSQIHHSDCVAQSRALASSTVRPALWSNARVFVRVCLLVDLAHTSMTRACSPYSEVSRSDEMRARPTRSRTHSHLLNLQPKRLRSACFQVDLTSARAIQYLPVLITRDDISQFSKWVLHRTETKASVASLNRRTVCQRMQSTADLNQVFVCRHWKLGALPTRSRTCNSLICF